MHKLQELLSQIQRRETDRKLQTTLGRRGNIARGKGVAPGTLRSAEVARATSLKRLGPTSRAAKQQSHLTHRPGQGATRRALQQRLAAGTEMNWKDKLFESLLERKEQEGDEAWEDFWKDKETEGDKSKAPKRKKKASRIRLRSKRTQAAIDRAKAKEEAEAKAETEAYRSGGRGR